MAAYIEAVETDDPAKATQVRSEILTYNEEDLDATRSGYQWVIAKSYGAKISRRPSASATVQVGHCGRSSHGARKQHPAEG